MGVGLAYPRRLGRWALWLCFTGGLAAQAQMPAQRDGAAVAGVPGGGAAHEVVLPRVLSAPDAALYARIFELQETGRWRAADHEIKQLGDRVLMGHVLAQRYLHPTRYRSRFSELKAWLAAYADHPEAGRIHWLAMRRKPSGAKAPRKPVPSPQPRLASEQPASDPVYVSPRKRSAAQRRALAKLRAHMRSHLRRGDPASAAKHLRKNDFGALADDVEFDAMRREIAHAYFLRGDDRNALKLAAASADRSGAAVPLARWTAGLAAVRLGDTGEARRHFEALATAANVADRMRAGAAFWAARINSMKPRPEEVRRFLEIAAAHPRTLYGLLAHRALGTKPEFSWDPPRLTDGDLDVALREPAVRRALALARIGQERRAELELRRLRAGSSPALGKAMLALAMRLELPAAQLRIALVLAARDGHSHDGAMYPLPPWRPDSGYLVDRALVFAVMRQESQFNTGAKSRAGARGLMQLMPSTASFIARNPRLRTSRRDDLFKPELNIELGQRYLLHLLDQPQVQGNLLYLVAAYNGGPGNLKKWCRRSKCNDDPLLFIESLPSRETRWFIEQVLTNLGIYRARLGQATPALDAIVAGRWPTYVPQDSVSMTVDARP